MKSSSRFVSRLPWYQTFQDRLELCCEELLYEMISRCYPPDRDEVKLKLDISFAEKDRETEISLSCRGAACNPFSQEGDALGMTILKRTASRIDYDFVDGENQITVRL